MTMKNSAKIAIAEQVVAHARSLGFEAACLIFRDDDGYPYDTLYELSEQNGCSPDETITASINIILDEDLVFCLIEDPDDEDADPRIEFAK